MKIKIVVFAIIIVLTSFSVVAQDVPADLQAKLMLKIISMDRNFDRFGEPIKIGASTDTIIKELNGITSLKIKGKDFSAEKINTLDDIAKYKVIYVGKNWASNYTAAGDKAAANQALMFCESEDGVLSGGGAVSFKVVDGKPKIVVNLEKAKKMGTDFPANFLQVTMVVGSLQ